MAGKNNHKSGKQAKKARKDKSKRRETRKTTYQAGSVARKRMLRASGCDAHLLISQHRVGRCTLRRPLIHV